MIVASAASTSARPLFLAIDYGSAGMTPNFGVLLRTMVASVAFALVGIVVFAFAFWVITKVTPFSVRKEIEKDQNTALAIIIGAVIIGIAMIVSAAVHG